MKKSDLKQGMIVTLANGVEYVVIPNFGRNEDFVVNIAKASCVSLTNYNDDLIYEFDLDYDIIKVERPNNPRFTLDLDYERDKRTVLWERPKPVNPDKLEFHFLEVYKELGYTFIARDSNDDVYAYYEKPVKKDAVWRSDADYAESLVELFPLIKWEDEEPWSITELLKLSDYEVVRKGV